MVLCLDDKELVLYSEFNCESDYDSSTPGFIVSEHLPSQNFEYFSAETDDNDVFKILVYPSDYDASQLEINKYTKQIKDFY